MAKTIGLQSWLAYQHNEYPQKAWCIVCILETENSIDVDSAKQFVNELLSFKRLRSVISLSTGRFGRNEYQLEDLGEDVTYRSVLRHLKFSDKGSDSDDSNGIHDDVHRSKQSVNDSKSKIFGEEPKTSERLRVQYINQLIEFILTEPFKDNCPLWECYYITDDPPNDFNKAASRFVVGDIDNSIDEAKLVILRFHHCVGDGVQLAAMASKVLHIEAKQTVTPSEAHQAALTNDAVNVLTNDAVNVLTNDAVNAQSKAVSDFEDSIPRRINIFLSVIMWYHLVYAFNPILKFIKNVMQGLSHFICLVWQTFANPLLPQNRTIITPVGKPTGKLELRFAGPYNLEKVKRGGKAMNATVNDIFMAVTAGAIRRYLTIHDPRIAELLDPKNRLNRFSSVYFRLVMILLVHSITGVDDFALAVVPMHFKLAILEDDPISRLLSMQREVGLLKSSIGRLWIQFVVKCINLSHLVAFKIRAMILRRICGEDFGIFRSSILLTNVAGPRESLTLGGTKINRIQPFVNLGSSLCIFSYEDQIEVTLATESNVFDSDSFKNCFDLEYMHLMTALNEMQ